MIYEKKMIQWKQTYKHNPAAENNSDTDQWIAAEIVSTLKRWSAFFSWENRFLKTTVTIPRADSGRRIALFRSY